MGKPKDNITILELGPGTGIMMLDILNVLKKNKDKVLDLGSSPGGWSQVASKLVGKEGKVFAPPRLSLH